jgi:hypothetical protein
LAFVIYVYKYGARKRRVGIAAARIVSGQTAEQVIDWAKPL